MKLRVLVIAILLSAIELVQLAVARPSLSQANPPNLSKPDLNAQLKQALCVQNWRGAIQVIDKMKKVAGPEHASQLTLYRGQLEAIARENARISGWTTGCAGDSSNPEVPGSNQPVPSPESIPQVPGSTQPMPGSEPIPQIPGSNQ
jgi:hypothetical protein